MNGMKERKRITAKFRKNFTDIHYELLELSKKN